jgi:hypothetical protein
MENYQMKSKFIDNIRSIWNLYIVDKIWNIWRWSIGIAVISFIMTCVTHKGNDIIFSIFVIITILCLTAFVLIPIFVGLGWLYSKIIVPIAKVIIAVLLIPIKYFEKIYSTYTEKNILKWKSKKNIGKLIKTLQKNSYDLRIKAAQVLGEIGDETAIDHLIIALYDNDEGVSEAALLALKTIGLTPKAERAIFIKEKWLKEKLNSEKGIESPLIPIQILIEQKKLIVDISGKSIKELHLKVKLLKNIKPPIKIFIPIGTHFMSKDNSVQNMVATKEEEITLSNYKWKKTILSVACANRSKKVPTIKDGFTIGEMNNEELLLFSQILSSKTTLNYYSDLVNIILLENMKFFFSIIDNNEDLLKQALIHRSSQNYSDQIELLKDHVAESINKLLEAKITHIIQAATWIITDNANYLDLDILKDVSSDRKIKEFEAAAAMEMCAMSEIDIKTMRIWEDSRHIYDTLCEIKNILKNNDKLFLILSTFFTLSIEPVIMGEALVNLENNELHIKNWLERELN